MNSQTLFNPLDQFVSDLDKYKIPLGKNQRLCIERYKDLKKDKRYYLDLEEVHKIINMTNKLTIVKNGRVEKFKTRGFQNFILGNIVGWKVKESGLRLYKEVYIQVGRQNGKSLLIGALSIYYSCFSKFRNANIFCTATKHDQAKIVWDNVANFIRYNPTLREKYFRIQEHVTTITSNLTRTKIKALGRDTKSMDGFDSVLSICDEYHMHPTDQMYKLLFDGQVNVDNSVIVAITTAGFDLSKPCHKQYEDCVNILNGLVNKDSIFIYITDPDKDDDIKDVSTWIKANPFLLLNEDYSINEKNLEKYQTAMEDAIRKQGEELINFMTKKLNMWVQFTDNDYLNKEKIKESASDMTLEDMRYKDVYIGIDLSSGGDLTSVGFVFLLDNNKKFIHSHSFIPEQRVLEHEIKSKVPYRDWIRRGLLTVTTTSGGYKTDYKAVLNYIKELVDKYELRIAGTGYDPYGAGTWMEDLTNITEEAISITQSARNLGSAVDDFKFSMDSGEVLFDKTNDLLKWSLANAKVEYNSFREPKVVKEKGQDKIDPVVALIDAWYLVYNKVQEIKDVNGAVDEWLEFYE